MKNLLLLRHAKSSRDDPGLPDFDRPLNDRGKSDAKLMGRFMHEKGIRPEVIVCSPAKRARRTAELVLKAAELSLTPVYDERIYEAEAQNLLQVISEIEPSVSLAMLVGHNPGFEELFHALTGETHFAAPCQKCPNLLQACGFRIVHADDQSPASRLFPSGSSCMREERAGAGTILVVYSMGTWVLTPRPQRSGKV